MTPFYIPISTWYEVSYLYHSMGIFHKQTLTCMGLTYALAMTTLVGPLQEIVEFAHQLLLWTCCFSPFSGGLLVTIPSASTTYSPRSMSSLVFPLMPTSKQWLSLVVYYKYIILNILCMKSISSSISCIKLRKCSYNQQDRGLRKTFPFKSFILAWNSSSTQQLIWLHSPCYLWACNCPDLSIW